MFLQSSFLYGLINKQRMEHLKLPNDWVVTLVFVLVNKRCNKLTINIMSKDDRLSLSNQYGTSDSQTVNVYLRNTRKQAKLVPLRTPAKACDLVAVASIRFNIPDKRIILFYNGFRIDNYSLPINLMEKGIVHILDRRNIDVDTIVVNFKPIGWNIPALRTQLTSDMTVQSVVDNFLVPGLHVQVNRFFIVYIGKILNLSNTLREELIENGAELMVVEHKGTKEAYEFNSSQHLRPLIQTPAIVNMPVTFNASILGLKKKNQDQALINQQQHSSAPGLDDSFFPNNQKTENAVAPGQKKEQHLQPSDKERSSGPNGEDNNLNKGRGDCAPDQTFKGTLLLQTNYNILKHGLQNTANPIPSVQQEQEDSEQAKKGAKSSS